MHNPLVALSVALPPTIIELMVTAGIGAPVIARLALANSTRLKVAPELLDHRSPLESNASSHGAWIEFVPSSLRVTSGVSMGVSMPVAGGTGRVAAVNSTMVVPAGL